MNDEIREHYKEGELPTLKSKILNKKILSKKEDKFLKQAELGIINFRLGEYKNSLENLRKAKKIAASLYTVSASKKIESFLLSDSDDNYYPLPFELSLIRFYELINHFILSTAEDVLDEGKLVKITREDNLFHRGAIEATLRDWHSYNENLADQKQGEALFKGTILADLMSIIFHDYLGSRHDKQKVKSFKKLAKNNLLTRMGIYSSFNNKVDVYRENYSKLHLKSKKEINEKFLDKTNSHKGVENFLNKEDYNVFVICMKSYVDTRKAEKIRFPLNLINIALPLNEKNDFLSFSRKALYLSHASDPTISFELPRVSARKIMENEKYLLKSSDGKRIEGRSILLSNNSEVMSQLLREEGAAIKTKVGLKLALKHAGFLLAAYTTYRGLRNQGEFVAYATASASYAIANKTIEHIEKADLRSWTGVHREIELIPLKLSIGKYQLEYLGKSIEINLEKEAKKIIPLFL